MKHLSLFPTKKISKDPIVLGTTGWAQVESSPKTKQQMVQTLRTERLNHRMIRVTGNQRLELSQVSPRRSRDGSQKVCLETNHRKWPEAPGLT
ncbi:hypothetical protein BaRGS_00013783 [Batillaria attramentaria]|uniref:Uncharacterized protein n=1 Tax=Batillaria attramentaria TaxID=370345 RepID=A0ABD0L775_9CAEN